MERLNNKKSEYTVVSLFSGIGGIDLGFEYAGFQTIWANDFDKYAVQSYRANVGDNIVWGDIRLVKNQIPSHDVLVGGFPCQPFSTLGKLQGFDDEQERGTLFFEIMDIIKRHDTKVVVLENVKNLINHDGGKTFERIKCELNDAGYDVNDPCTYFSTMGCRTANGYDINGLGQRKDGRGNICPTTIILPTVAKEAEWRYHNDMATMDAESLEEVFMEMLDYCIHEAKDMLIERFEWICKQSPKAASFMYENNTMTGYYYYFFPITCKALLLSYNK